MSIDDKMLMDLANQIGMGGRNSEQASDMISDAAEKFSGKGDDQILNEILKLKQVLSKDRKSFDKQLEMILSLKPMMTPEQRKKLDGLLQILNS